MNVEGLVQYLLKTYPEVSARPNHTIEQVMYAQGKRDAVLDILRHLGRDATGGYIGTSEGSGRRVTR